MKCYCERFLVTKYLKTSMIRERFWLWISKKKLRFSKFNAFKKDFYLNKYWDFCERNNFYHGCFFIRWKKNPRFGPEWRISPYNYFENGKSIYDIKIVERPQIKCLSVFPREVRAKWQALIKIYKLFIRMTVWPPFRNDFEC